MTITHPYHPLCGQKVAVIRRKRGVNDTLIVRAPNGYHMAVALDSTDHVAEEGRVSPAKGTPHLLDIEGLWAAVQLIEQIQQRDHTPRLEAEASGDASYD